MVTINHVDFHVIIEQVWMAMDMPSVLVASHVCSDWRRRARKVLQRHVLLTTNLLTGCAVLTPTSLDYPHLRYPRYTLGGDAVLRSSFPPASLTHHEEAVIRNMAVLDVGDDTDSPWLEYWLQRISATRELHSLPALTIRMQARSPPEALCGYGSPQVYFLPMNRYGSYLVARSPGEVIVNLECRTSNKGPLLTDDRVSLGVRRLATGPTPAAGAFVTYVLRNVWQNLVGTEGMGRALRNFLRHVVACWEGSPLRFVGLEAFFEDNASFEYFRTELEEAFDYAQHRAEMDDENAKNIRADVLTRLEYEDLIGDAAYRLYTTPIPL